MAGRTLIAAFAVALVAVAPSAAVSRTIPWSKLVGLQTGPAPWRYHEAGLAQRIGVVGLSRLPAEGTALHIHQHLDLYVAGRKVTLPANVGINFTQQFITEVHTHDTTGLIHVESPTQRDFRLGQLFGEWGVKLTASCVGRYCGHLKWWVNGQQVTGDPAQLILRPHQEIVIAEGPPPLVVPKSWPFPVGT